MKFLIRFTSLTLVFCCVVFAAIYATQQKSFSESHGVKDILSKIPKEDYDALDKLFRCLVFENYFAYTLFGTKPMTYHGAFYEQPVHVTIDNPNSASINHK